MTNRVPNLTEHTHTNSSPKNDGFQSKDDKKLLDEVRLAKPGYDTIASSGIVEVVTDTSLSGNGVIGTPLSVVNDGHTHDTRYYTEAEVNALIPVVANGAFTPVVYGTTSAGTGTYTFRRGWYERSGNKVDVWIALAWTAHTGTGNMRISGLPFTQNGNFYSPLASYMQNIALSANNILQLVILPSTSEIVVGQYALTTGAVSAVPMDTDGNLYLHGVMNILV